MLYGLGAPVDILSPAIAALPECFSQELSNCLDHDNVDGLPKTQCDTIRTPYLTTVDDATTERMSHAINALPICTGPSMVPYVGAAFAVGVLLTAMLVKR